MTEVTIKPASPSFDWPGYLTAYVSLNDGTIGIDHETDADWHDILRAHISLRDRLNERIAEKEACPLNPEQPADARNTRPASTEPADALDRDYTKRRIKELTDEGDGFWRPCSGCQESCDGYVSEKDYPYSDTFRCQPGSGCGECGGIGVIWDDTDYSDFGREENPLTDALAEAREALEPVLHWYQSDEYPARPIAELVADIVADLQTDRRQALTLPRLIKAADRLSVCAQTTGGTAGRDEELIAAIDEYSKAAELVRAALSRLNAQGEVK